MRHGKPEVILADLVKILGQETVSAIAFHEEVARISEYLSSICDIYVLLKYSHLVYLCGYLPHIQGSLPFSLYIHPLVCLSSNLSIALICWPVLFNYYTTIVIY